MSAAPNPSRQIGQLAGRVSFSDAFVWLLEKLEPDCPLVAVRHGASLRKLARTGFVSGGLVASATFSRSCENPVSANSALWSMLGLSAHWDFFGPPLGSFAHEPLAGLCLDDPC
jgi:hypothetical protein